MNRQRSQPTYLTLIDFISRQSLFLAVQRSLSVVLPLIMVGSLTLMVRNFPWSAAQHVLNDLLGPSGQMACDNLISGTFGIASLALLCALSGVSAMYSNQRRSGPFVSPIMSAVVVLACFSW